MAFEAMPQITGIISAEIKSISVKVSGRSRGEGEGEGRRLNGGKG